MRTKSSLHFRKIHVFIGIVMSKYFFLLEKTWTIEPRPTKTFYVCFLLFWICFWNKKLRVLAHNWRLGQLMVYANIEQKQLRKMHEYVQEKINRVCSIVAENLLCTYYSYGMFYFKSFYTDKKSCRHHNGFLIYLKRIYGLMCTKK